MNTEKTKDEKYHGFYSARHDIISGHAVFLDENGKEVLVTCASSTEDPEMEYSWSDRIYVGIVTTWVRNIYPDGRGPPMIRRGIL